MPVRNNPILGYTICSECEEPATVHQQSRGSGRFLYTRGCDCKYRNSTGKVFQTRLWYSTDWVPGADPVKPPNLAEPPEVTPEPRERIEPDVVADEVDEAEDDESVSGWLVTGISLLVGAAMFLVSGG